MVDKKRIRLYQETVSAEIVITIDERTRSFYKAQEKEHSKAYHDSEELEEQETRYYSTPKAVQELGVFLADDFKDAYNQYVYHMKKSYTSPVIFHQSHIEFEVIE